MHWFTFWMRSQVASGTSQVELISLTTLVGRRLLTAAAVGLVIAAVLLVLLELVWPPPMAAPAANLVFYADWGVPEAVKTDNGKDFTARHVETADRHGIAMVMTGRRQFRH